MIVVENSQEKFLISYKWMLMNWYLSIKTLDEMIKFICDLKSIELEYNLN